MAGFQSLLSIGCVLLLCGVAGAARAEGNSESVAQCGKAKVGEKAPWFAGLGLDNRPMNRDMVLRGLGGKGTVAVVFFATWCEPCKVGLRMLTAALPDLRRAGVTPILIAYQQDAETVRPFVESAGLNQMTVLLDRMGVASREFGAEVVDAGGKSAKLPLTAVIDAGGTVRTLIRREGTDYIDLLKAASTPDARAPTASAP